MGHQHGDSKEFVDSVKLTDQQVGQVWQAIKKREATMNEDWLLIVTTDHGRDAETGKDHGGQSSRERTTWIVTNSQKLNKNFNENTAIVDILPTIAAHLNIQIPERIKDNLEGVSFIKGAFSER
jgi:bisphosphoglycerate-independent phosphoglycerate mutase (AlkP superfamily)